jgi:anhydro-N-acetylmuramic acid kinase
VRVQLGSRKPPPIAREDPEPVRKARAARGQATTGSQRRDERARLVVGCMTGTSLDGLDVALVRIHGHGLAMHLEHLQGLSVGLGALAGPLRRLAEQQPITAREIAQAMHAFAQLHVAAIRDLHAERIDLVVVHGQTVYHAPPVSWQLCAPSPISHALQVPVVYDLRAADIAAGGQGAPITPLADFVLFRHGSESRAVVNLGGFCNITMLPGGHDATRIQGADVCACNQLLDALARTLWDIPFDHHGERAATGTVDRKALAALAPLLSLQARSGRSLGTGDELSSWIARHRGRCEDADLARTACAAIAQTISHAAKDSQRLVLAGGGVRNRTLLGELQGRSQVPVVTSDSLKIPIDMREAIGMAILGALCQDRIPITVPGITGVETAPVSGCWSYPTARDAAITAPAPARAR